MEKVRSALKKHHIINALNSSELELLCGSCVEKGFQSGEILIKEEVPNHYLYLIMEGEVVVKSYGIKIRSQFIGSLLGVISAAGLGSVTDDSATVQVVAKVPTRAVCFPIDTIQQIAKNNEAFAEALYEAAMSRLLS